MEPIDLKLRSPHHLTTRAKMAAPLTSVAGMMALLDEKDVKLQEYALQKLNTLVDRFWAELADSLARLEELYEDEAFQQRHLAALVVSKIYFYLGEFDEALSLSLIHI